MVDGIRVDRDDEDEGPLIENLVSVVLVVVVAILASVAKVVALAAVASIGAPVLAALVVDSDTAPPDLEYAVNSFGVIVEIGSKITIPPVSDVVPLGSVKDALASTQQDVL